MLNGCISIRDFCARMSENRQAPFVGRSMPRREDRRLLTGRGQFIADLDLPHMLHAVFVRSPVAHARIRARRSRRAPLVARRRRSCPERRRARAAAAAGARTPSSRCRANGRARGRTSSSIRSNRCSAHDKVRHVGEAVAVIVAESRHAAEDAAQLVDARSRSAARRGRPGGGIAPGRADHPRHVPRPTSSAPSPSARAMSTPRSRALAAPAATPLPSSPLCRCAHGVPRRRRRP